MEYENPAFENLTSENQKVDWFSEVNKESTDREGKKCCLLKVTKNTTPAVLL